MKVSKLEVETGNPGYIDVDVFFTVGATEWWLRTSLDLETDQVVGVWPQSADEPHGDFGDPTGPVPGVVLRAYAAMRPQVLALIEKHRPKKVFDPDMEFETVAQAARLVASQAEPLDALMATVRCNILKDEYGFASELITAYQTEPT